MAEFNYNDERLSIINVATKCSIKLKDNNSARGRMIGYCPFCDDTKGHLYLTIEGSNNYNNVYKCFKCGKKGSAVSLYAELKGLDTKEAFKQLIEDTNSDNINVVKKIIQKTTELPKPIEAKEVEYLNKVYTTFLKLLKLNERDYKNLRARGLDRETILKKGYKSIPIGYREKYIITNELIKSGFKLEGVPGFFVDKYKKWTFISREGYLVPIKDLNGNIYSMQIRLVKSEDGVRYKYFSTNGYEKGSKALAGVHFVKGDSLENVYITEGPLKGDVANFFSNDTFLCIPGVNSGINILVEMLKELNSKLTVIAFDMDMYSNCNVKRALIKLIKTLEKLDIKATIKLWDKEYKGIDDYYKNINENKST